MSCQDTLWLSVLPGVLLGLRGFVSSSTPPPCSSLKTYLSASCSLGRAAKKLDFARQFARTALSARLNCIRQPPTSLALWPGWILSPCLRLSTAFLLCHARQWSLAVPSSRQGSEGYPRLSRMAYRGLWSSQAMR